MGAPALSGRGEPDTSRSPPTVGGYDARVEGLERRLREVLEPQTDVLVAYLCGSFARGTAGPLSDVDVAVLLAPGADRLTRLCELTGVIEKVAGPGRADLVALDTAPVALGYRVLRDGRLLVCHDEAARVGHWDHTVLAYLDMERFFRMLEEGLRHRVVEGRFGRP